MLRKMLWIEIGFQTNSNGEAHARQVFVTRSVALAEKVEDYFYKMLESIGTSTRRRPDRGPELVDRDEDSLRDDLPLKYSDLEEKHFPLFIAFDRVRSLSLAMRLFSEFIRSFATCWKAIW